MSVRLGEILVKEALITQDQLQKALEFQRSNGGKLGSCLTKMGFITDDDITGVLSRQYGVPSINLKYYEIDPTVIKLDPARHGHPLPGDSALPRRLDPHHRDDRPHQRLRDGRHQVHDRLQRRAGCRLGIGHRRSHRPLLRRQRPESAKNSAMS